MRIINYILLSGLFLLLGLLYSPWWSLGATVATLAALAVVWRETRNTL